MNKEIKEKKKKLNRNYSDYYYEVIAFLTTKSLSRYAYYKLRDDAIEKIYDCQERGESPKNSFHHGHELYFEKKINTYPKKSILEKIGGFSFAFFALFFVLFLFVYIYHFFVYNSLFYSKGIYLFIAAKNISNMLLYGFLGALVSVFVQKNDRKTKNILAIGTGIFGFISILAFYIIGENYSSPIRINALVMFVVCLCLSSGGFILETMISKKKCIVKEENREKL